MHAKTRARHDDPAPFAAPCRLMNSRDLFGSQRRIQIVHDGQVYVLQVTRQGKLILTK